MGDGNWNICEFWLFEKKKGTWKLEGTWALEFEDLDLQKSLEFGFGFGFWGFEDWEFWILVSREVRIL